MVHSIYLYDVSHRMKYIVISTPLISWKIKEKSSTQLRLTSLPGCYILSPVSYSKAYEESHLLDKGRFHKLQGHYFLKTTGLLVKYTGNDNEDLSTGLLFF